MTTCLLQMFALTPVPVGRSDIGRWIGSGVGVSSTLQAGKTLELDGELQ
jgi:hypothetical protein